MGLLDKTHIKGVFFYAKYQNTTRKLCHSFFYVILHPYNKMQEYLHEHND